MIRFCEESLHEVTQQRAHVHDDPERRALAEPRRTTAADGHITAERDAAPTRLTQNTCAHNEPHVRHAKAIHYAKISLFWSNKHRRVEDTGREVLEHDLGLSTVDGVGKRVRVAV